MTELIFQGAVLGLIAGACIAVALRKPEASHRKTTRGSAMTEGEQNTQNRKSLLDRWSVRLSLIGVAMGIFTTFSQGSTQIGFMIGFSIPYVLVLGGVGLVIDYFKSKNK